MVPGEWVYDPTIWIGWAVFIGAVLFGLAVFVIILVLSEPHRV